MRTGWAPVQTLLFFPWLARVSFSFSPFAILTCVYLLSRNGVSVLNLRFGFVHCRPSAGAPRLACLPNAAARVGRCAKMAHMCLLRRMPPWDNTTSCSFPDSENKTTGFFNCHIRNNVFSQLKFVARMSVISLVSFDSLCSQGLVAWDGSVWEGLSAKILSENRWSLTDGFQLRRDYFEYLPEKWFLFKICGLMGLRHLFVSWRQTVTDKIHSWVMLSLCSSTCVSVFIFFKPLTDFL